jgi:hypothetical protein
MEKQPARAMLVSAADVGGGLTTAVSRSEIEEVLASEGEPIELVLDVTRFSDGEAAESRRLAVSWERSDLERLLSEAAGEQVQLTFDREALQQAMAADVEAHGIRETVLALAVAATAATGAAAKASADPGPPFLDSGTSGVVRDLAPDDRSAPRPTPVVAPTSDLAPDDRAVPRATPVTAPTPDLAPDDRRVRPTPVAAPTPDLAPDDRAAPRLTPVAAPTPDLAPDDRGVRPTPVSPPATGTVSDGTSWGPSPVETAVIAGALALAITGAFFLVGGRRIRPRLT